MSARTQVLVAICALSTSACYPVLHDVPVTPLVSGVITLHGKPLPNIVVRLYDKDPVLAEKMHIVTAKTDASGSFRVGPVIAFQFFGGKGNWGTDWRLEFDVDNARHIGWQNRALGSPSRLLDVTCELDEPVKSGTLGFRSTGEGICTIVSEKED